MDMGVRHLRALLLRAREAEPSAAGNAPAALWAGADFSYLAFAVPAQPECGGSS